MVYSNFVLHTYIDAKFIHQKSTSFWVVELWVSFIFVFVVFPIFLLFYSVFNAKNFLFQIGNPRTFTPTYCKIFFSCIFVSHLKSRDPLSLRTFIVDKFLGACVTSRNWGIQWAKIEVERSGVRVSDRGHSMTIRITQEFTKDVWKMTESPKCRKSYESLTRHKTQNLQEESRMIQIGSRPTPLTRPICIPGSEPWKLHMQWGCKNTPNQRVSREFQVHAQSLEECFFFYHAWWTAMQLLLEHLLRWGANSLGEVSLVR